MSRGNLKRPPNNFNLTPKENISKGARIYYRFNPAGHTSCLYFSENKKYRFDDPDKQYGVFYAAEQPSGAFAETYGHDITEISTSELLVLSEAELKQRQVFIIRIKSARLAMLADNGLSHLRLDGNICTTTSYEIPQQWSRWIHQHPNQYDGILYKSRHNSCNCVALFSRAKKRITSEKNLGSALYFQHPKTRETIFDIMEEQGWSLYP